MSERRGWDVAGLSRSVYRYRSRRVKPEGFRTRMRELAAERPRYGYPRLHVLLRREGFRVNHKRTYRIYREERLQVRRRPRKRVAAAPREKLPVPTTPHRRWSMDFVSDSLLGGQAFRTLNIVDDCTRLCVAQEVDISLPGERVGRVLDRAAARYGWPEVIVMDNGPEFTSKALDQWAWHRGVHLHFIRPGKPIENAFVESFNGKFREECLNANWFTSLSEARRLINEWRLDYNTHRPHRSLQGRTPLEFEQSLSSGPPLRGSPPDRLSNHRRVSPGAHAITPRTRIAQK